MSRSHKRLVSACCGMDLCWLCAWADFLAVATSTIRVPLTVLCAAFLTALFISGFFKARGYRIIWMLLSHVLGLGLVISGAVFDGIGWIFPKTVFHWYEMMLIAGLVCLFWYKGITLSRRQMSYKPICNYFDLGISLFFALLVIKMLLQLKGGIHIEESLTLYCMGGYFFFGLAALFFSQNSAVRGKKYVAGYGLHGAVISFVMVVLAWGMGIVLLLLPFLTGFAESGYGVLKQVAGPLTPYLVSVLRFIFSVQPPSGSSSAAPHGLEPPGPGIALVPGQGSGLEQAFFSGILAIFLLLSMIMAVYMACRIFKFLMSKQSGSARDKTDFMFFSWLKHWLARGVDFFQHIIQALGGKVETGGSGFIRLVAWGRKSGMPKKQSETPAEYANRLQQRFVPLENDIRTIVRAFEQETYGEISLDISHLARMTTALKTIHSPLFWWLRIKTLFFPL